MTEEQSKLLNSLTQGPRTALSEREYDLAKGLQKEGLVLVGIFSIMEITNAGLDALADQ